LATKQAVATYDAEQVTVAQMIAAIKQAGFAARRHQ
jgi:copper chaperone CopZ